MKPEVNQTFRINTSHNHITDSWSCYCRIRAGKYTCEVAAATMRTRKVIVRGKDDGSYQVATRFAETSSGL